MAEFKKLTSIDGINIGEWYLVASPKRVVRIIEKDNVGIRDRASGEYITSAGFILEATWPTVPLYTFDKNECVQDAHEAREIQYVLDHVIAESEKLQSRWDDKQWRESWAVRQVILHHIPIGSAAHRDRHDRLVSEVFCVGETRKDNVAKTTSPIEDRAVEIVRIKQVRGLPWDNDADLPDNFLLLRSIAIKEGLEIPEDCKSNSQLKELIEANRKNKDVVSV